MTRLICAVVLTASVATNANAADFPKFKEKVIDPNVGKVCYAVTVADVNGDKKTDIVAVTENRVIWYENPTWKKHVILEDQTERDNVCIAPLDIDGDGKVDFALGAGWTKVGTIQWITRGKPGEKWKVYTIGKERWLHRMRFADVLGKGKPQLVISPLNATGGRKGVRLTAFEIPKNPKTDPWKRHLMDASLNRMHNHWHVKEGKAADTVTASREGVHVIIRMGSEFKRMKLADGARGKTPNSSGAGEVKVGKLKPVRSRSRAGTPAPFIATVEPMHGNMLVVYTRGEPSTRGSKAAWKRHVLTDKLVRGHALWTADLDGDGSDEIVIGHSNTVAKPGVSRGVYVYDTQNAAGTKWKKHVIDEGGMATEDAIVADFNGDGKPDIVAGGRYTHNVKLYVNQGK